MSTRRVALPRDSESRTREETTAADEAGRETRPAQAPSGRPESPSGRRSRSAQGPWPQDPEGRRAAPKPAWADGKTDGPTARQKHRRGSRTGSRPPRRRRDPTCGGKHDRETTVGDIPVHVAPLTGRRRRSRVFVAAVVLLCLLFAFVAVAAILSSRHNPTAATAGPRATSPSEVSVARMERRPPLQPTAATVTTRSKLDAIPGIPTLTNVAAVILPYVTSLERYETALTGTVVPAAAQTSVAGVRSLVAQDLQFLDTLDGLPSLGLGTYLAEVGKRSTQLQTVFGQVEGTLHTANQLSGRRADGPEFLSTVRPRILGHRNPREDPAQRRGRHGARPGPRRGRLPRRARFPSVRSP